MFFFFKLTSKKSLKYLAISYELLAEIHVSLRNPVEAVKLFQKACPLLHLLDVQESFGGNYEPINKRCIRVLKNVCNADPGLSELCLGVEGTATEYNNWKSEIENRVFVSASNNVNKEFSQNSEESKPEQSIEVSKETESKVKNQKVTEVHLSEK
jgi:hypothetical protein